MSMSITAHYLPLSTVNQKAVMTVTLSEENRAEKEAGAT